MTVHAGVSFSRRKLFSSLWEHEDDRRCPFQALLASPQLPLHHRLSSTSLDGPSGEGECQNSCFVMKQISSRRRQSLNPLQALRSSDNVLFGPNGLAGGQVGGMRLKGFEQKESKLTDTRSVNEASLSSQLTSSSKLLVADKRQGPDLKQIGRIRVEWAGTGELVACRWEESRVTFEDAKLAFTHIYPDIYPP